MLTNYKRSGSRGHPSQSWAGNKSRNAMDFTTDISVQYLKEQLFLQWYKFLQFLNNVVSTLVPSLQLSEKIFYLYGYIL